MKKTILLASFLVLTSFSSKAHACQYGIGWSEIAMSAVSEEFGSDATNIKVKSLIDKSRYILTRSDGVNCPDRIRGVAKVSFRMDGQDCMAKVILNARYSEKRLGRVECNTGK